MLYGVLSVSVRRARGGRGDRERALSLEPAVLVISF